MKKFTTLLTGCLILTNTTFATLNYSLAISNPGFTQLVSPNNISGFNCSCGDQIVSSPINIGFTFVFDGVSYTQFEVSDNGQLFLGAPAYTCSSNCATTCNFSEIEPANLSGGTDRNVICPLWDDLGFNNCGGGINYQLSGAAGNHVMTIEWLLVDWKYNNTNNPHGAISFQVKLYEATPGQIDFIYRQDAQALGTNTQAPHARIGLMGVMGDYYSTSETGATPSKTTEFIVATKPADGAQFRWSDMSSTSVKYINRENINVYPNPVVTNMVIDFTSEKISSIEIYNEIGCKVYSTNKSVQNINLSTLPPGLYFIIINSDTSLRRRFIKL